jgi:hypothetical protein
MTANGRDFITLTYQKGNFISLPATLQETSLWNFIKGKSKYVPLYLFHSVTCTHK